MNYRDADELTAEIGRTAEEEIYNVDGTINWYNVNKERGRKNDTL